MSINRHFPVLIVVAPLLASYLAPMLWRWQRRLVKPIVLSAAALSFSMSLSTALQVLRSGPVSYHVGSWEPPWGIELYVDYLSAYMAVVVTAVGLLILIYATEYAEKLVDEKNRGLFFTLALLLIAGLTGMVVTGDVFNLFVFLEIASLASYALVPIAGKKGSKGRFEASFRYLYMGAIASTFILIGIGLAYMATGTLNMADMARLLPEARQEYPRLIVASLGFFIVGFSIKCALFPLHLWLPDAYAHAPMPVNALSSGLTIKVMAYAMIRLFYSVFGIGFVSGTGLLSALQVIAGTAIIVGSLLAITQNDVIRILAYSSVSQIGYIILGATLVTKDGLAGSLLHILHHSVMKGAMLLAVGAVIYKTGKRDIRDYRGLGKRMPYTMGAFSIAALSMVGIPPLTGFVSKWILLLGTVEAKSYAFTFVILASSLLNAVYYFRLINYIHFKGETAGEVDEAPPAMLIPIIILGLGAIFLGVLAGLPLTIIWKAVASAGL
ncbi:MAG: monovalent cation/H+ antiporter subunit D family protein [Methanobacteriota archaeon]|nr:MAG: monovalent cation/H+ antiporter subunit D family protein [Euryarchaeota archaeon]